jgi:hypothetical protein
MATCEKAGIGSMGLSGSGVAVKAAAATAAMGVAVTMIAQQAGPEPGYHLKPEHYDFVGGGLIFGIAVASLYATFRALRASDFL